MIEWNESAYGETFARLSNGVFVVVTQLTDSTIVQLAFQERTTTLLFGPTALTTWDSPMRDEIILMRAERLAKGLE